jgi:hypothetical protein
MLSTYKFYMERYSVDFRRKARVIHDLVKQFVNDTVGESYHDPLRRIYRKLLHDFPTITEHLTLPLANKAVNDTVGPKALYQDCSYLV